MIKKTIPLSIPNFEGNEKKYINDAISQGWVSTGGSYVSKFEQELARFLKISNVAVCQSGTSALHLSMVEAGIQPGDVVLVPPVTFIAAVNPVKYQFATPVFIDCDDSLCMDPFKLNSFCETECVWDGEKLKFKDAVVKALVVVHVFGNLADMESIMDTAKKYNIVVIEDATEALGTYYTEGRFAGKYAGTIGNFGAYSFNGNKIITTGGGGAITSNMPETVDHLRYLSTQAKDNPKFYYHNEVGYNYRMTNIQAALGVAQMEKLQDYISRKQRNYEIYKREFSGCKYIELMTFRKETSSNKWLYNLKIDFDHIDYNLYDLISDLERVGIQTRSIWGLINEQKPYRGEVTYKLEKAPFYSSRILSIPSSTQITKEEIVFVADNIKRLIYNHSI